MDRSELPEREKFLKLCNSLQMSAPPLLGLLSQKLFQNQRLISVCDARHDIIVIGASAGGVQALRTLVAGFPAHLRGSLFIMMHIAASLPTTLPQILSRAGPLPALHPTENMVIEQGKIYVAPPDHHLLLEEGHMYLGTGPKELRVRPAANTLFRSAAHAYEPRVVGVVLTGTDRDGTAGLQAVKQQGGITIVQDPQEAPWPSMPQSALEQVVIDSTVPLSQMASLLVRLVEPSL